MTEMGVATPAPDIFWDITLVTVLSGGELWGLHHRDISVLEWIQNNFLRRFLSLRQVASLRTSETSAPVPTRPFSVHKRVSAASWVNFELCAQRSFPPATC